MKIRMSTIVRAINKRKTDLKRFGIKKLHVSEDWVPIRRWLITWGLPKDCNTKNNELWCLMESVENFLKRTRGQLSKYWRGSQNKVRGSLRYKIENGNIWVRMSCKWHHKFKPQKFILKNGYICCQLPEDYVAIWYNCKRINGIRSVLVVPKLIKLGKIFFQSLGLLQGEMSKSVYTYTFDFANSEGKILKTILVFLKKFDISPEDCKARILVSSKNISKNHVFREKLERRLRNYWSKTLNIPLSNFTSISWRDGKKGTVKYGNLAIRYSNGVFHAFTCLLLLWVGKIIEKNKNFIKYYLQGVFAAEGCSYTRWDYALTSVIIGAKDKEVRKYYDKLLRIIGIRSKETNKGLWIKGWGNFNILFEMKCFVLHPLREVKFLYGFLNCKHSQTFLQLEPFLTSSKSISEHMSIFNLSYPGARHTLNSLTRLGCLIRKEHGTQYNPYRYSITPKGSTIIEKLIEGRERFHKMANKLEITDFFIKTKEKEVIVYNNLTNGEVDAKTLAQKLGMGRSEVSRILVNLNRRGIVKRIRRKEKIGSRNFSKVFYKKL